MSEFCVVCGKLLEEDEDMVCSECFERSEHYLENLETELDFNDE